MEVLRAALNHAWRCHKLKNQIPITLPKKSAPRARWLTTSEAARLLLGSLGCILAPYSDLKTRAERWTIWRRDRSVKGHHLARFILIGIRTGTRAEAILSLGWKPHAQGGHFDLENRLMFRATAGAKQSKKRKPPAPTPTKLARHLSRWKRFDQSRVQEDGSPVIVRFVVTPPGYDDAEVPTKRVSKAFNSAVARAGLDRTVTPHTLRHTCVTWLIQRGRPIFEVARFVGMTPQMVEDVYGHHAPEFLRETADA
ncbi:hypothetical protein A1351_08610 [Methylosinus sp. R-45379]|nr:hypothetical protein A1351_08610 [Methylosinus sp. R-45379]